MAEETAGEPAATSDHVESSLLHGVIVGVTPGQTSRVVREAARYAKLLQVELLVVHVDVSRFVTYEDPDGYVHTAPIDVSVGSGEVDLERVRAEAESVLASSGVSWTVRQLVGDPAHSLTHLADEIEARLIVVGTRKRGVGESIREFFMGSVAARLAHRQKHPILVVPLGEPTDIEDLWPVS